ncbi:UDP-3-O-(3-hydroxymyristoyl)glucosamine N-acyltransferase [Natronospora cellulosivora (SeqCode)]
MLNKKVYTAEYLAKKVEGKLNGDYTGKISEVAAVSESNETSITFAESKNFIKAAKKSSAAVVIVPEGVEISGKTTIQVENPRLAYAIISSLFAPDIYYKPGVHKSAVIAETAKIGENVSIHPNVVIDENAEIADNVILAPAVYIGKNVKVGKNTLIHPNVVVEYDTEIGDNVIIQSGTVIASDGYGFVSTEEGHYKIPQLGNVIIGDDVEIGANVTIDRGASGPTMIAKGTKVDNLVQIAHNVKIGQECLIIAQVGIAGSSELGDRVILAGKTGVVDHIKIADNATIASNSTVTKDIPSSVFYSGNPAHDHKSELREQAARRRLPELLKTVKKLEKKIKELESEISEKD